MKYASLAPSGHNAQPWRVEILKGDKWLLKLDHSRRLSVVDKYDREAKLSLGAFLENLELAAQNYGYKTEFIIDDQTENIEINLREDQVKIISIEQLEQRRTLRKNHLNKKISKKDLNYLIEDCSRTSFYHNNTNESKIIEELIYNSNVKQIDNDKAQKELSEWIRWTNSEAEKYRDGLTPSSMELSEMEALFVRWFFDKEDVLSGSFREKSKEMVKEQLAYYGGWLVITSEDESFTDLIQAGKKFQKIALKSKNKKLALHPMMQIIEESNSEELRQELGIKDNIQFIVRASYVDDYHNAVSLRRPVREFLTFKY